MTEFAVLNTTFNKTPLKKIFVSCGIKVQESDKSEKNSIIFPIFNTAFLVYEAKELFSGNALDEIIVSSIVRFLSLNKNSKIILICKLDSIRDVFVYTEIQNRLRHLNCFVNISADYFDCAQSIQEILKLYIPNVRQSIVDVIPVSTDLTCEEQENLYIIAEKLEIEL